MGPLLLPKGTKPELSIVDVHDTEPGTCRVLFYFLDLDILGRIASDLLCKHELKGLKVVHANVGLVLVAFGDSDGSGRVVADAHGDDGVHGHNAVRVQQVLEDPFVGSEAEVRSEPGLLPMRILDKYSAGLFIPCSFLVIAPIYKKCLFLRPIHISFPPYIPRHLPLSLAYS